MIGDDTFVIAHRAIQVRNQAQATINRKNTEIGALENDVGNLAGHIYDLVAQVEQLQLALAIEKAHAAGLNAYVKAARAENSGNGVFSDSGQRYKNGNMKLKGAVIYEDVFDTTARDLGINNPKDHRYT